MTRSDATRSTVLAACAALSLSAAGPVLGADTHGGAFRWDLGIGGGILWFLKEQPFVLLFLVLGVGTWLGRLKLGFLSLGSTAATLLVGIVVSALAFLFFEITYEVPSLLTTVTLNLFMFAVGLKVGPQFFAGLRLDGVKLVIVALIVVGLNFVLVFFGSKMFGLEAGSATGIIAGSMTDSAVIGAASGAVQAGTYQPPPGMTGADVIGEVAAGYAICYLFSLIGIIMMIRYLPRIFGIDLKAAAREAEASYGGESGAGHGASTTYAMPRTSVDVRAYRVEEPAVIGRTLREVSVDYNTGVLKLLRNGQVVDLRSQPRLQQGDIVTVITDVGRLVAGAQKVVGPEVADALAREIDLEVADLVVTNHDFERLDITHALDLMRERLAAAGEPGARMLHVVALVRAGEPLPLYLGTRLQRGDVVRVVGPSQRIDQIGAYLGQVIRDSYVSDVVTLAFGLAIGYVFGYLSVTVGGIPISLGTPAGVMLAGIMISTLRSRYPLFGGPVSEGARSLLQDLGLDLFIAAVAVNTAPNVVAAFSEGGVGQILAVGLVAAFVPPLVAWVVGLRILKLNAAVLLGAISGARFSTPALRAAQEEAGSSVPAVGYPVGYAVTAVLVLVAGYLALFL
jgi:putative transport protein